MHQMATREARGWHGFRAYLEMIKIEHSIFALPFAMIGAMWGASVATGRLWPTGVQLFWIVVAMVTCRSAAMAFNRIADRAIDAKNPRTAIRALPAGLLSLRTTNLYFYGSIAIFVLAAAQLNTLALMLSPIALLFTLGYSMSKRFTWLCHVILGFSLGIAPAAAYLAVTGRLDAPILLVTAAVTFWTAGFDIIYALQDDEFDRREGLFSIPACFGRKRALLTSRIFHAAAVGCLVGAGVLFGVTWPWWVGVAVAAVLLAYEQSLVRADDLSKVNLAFFTFNGWISMAMFLSAAGERWVSTWQ